MVFAADHTVTTGTTTVDCDTFDGGVAAGDTLTFATGTRGDIIFLDCVGTAGNEIVIRNPASEQTIINCTGTFCFEINRSEHVIVNGTQKWTGAPAGGCGATFVDLTVFQSDPAAATANQQCGIKLQCSSGGSQQMVSFQGSEPIKHVTLSGMELASGFPGCKLAAPGTGFTGHNQNVTVITHPGEFWEGNKWLHNFIHDTASECMYIGQNIKTPRFLVQRDHEIAYNVMTKCGYDGIELKSAFQAGQFGNTQIHHNIISEAGVGPIAGGNNGIGISVYESGFTDVHHNWVQDTFPPGTKSGNGYGQLLQNILIADAASLTVSWFNNVAVDVAGHAFNTFQKAATTSDAVGIVYNNTTIGAGKSGINFNAEADLNSGTVQDNIACDSTDADVSAVGTVNNNTTGACSAVGFENLGGRDLHLTSDTNDGGNFSSPPGDDFDGVSRPQGLGDDRGAFEFIVGGPADGVTAPKPEPHVMDTGEALHPDYLYVLNEGTGNPLEDDGSATDCDLTNSGGDWASDALGRYLSFVTANSDFAENTSCTALAGSSVTRTICAVVRIAAPTGIPGETVAGIFDASDADQGFSLQSTQGQGFLQAAIVQSGGAGSNTNEGPTVIANNVLHMACVKASDTTLDLSLDGAAFDVEVQALSGVFTGIDTIALGAKRRLASSNHADAHIYAMWAYTSAITDAQVSTMFNSGDPWPIIGVDPASGPPPVAQRGQESHTAGVTN